MFVTLVHLACDALSRLVALDEGDGLLNFKMLLQPVAQEYEGTNGPLIIAVALCGGVLEFLIRHAIIRVLGTCLVVACMEEHQQHVPDSETTLDRDEATSSASVVSLLRRTKLLRARVRRSITYAFAYSIAAGVCSTLVSSVSESYIWSAPVEIATAVLLERIHFRWTHSIVGRTSYATHGYSWRALLLPTVVHALARKIVAELPATIDAWFVAESTTSTEAVATRDIAVLGAAFMLRFFVLYPAWEALIACETRRTSEAPDTLKNRIYTYSHMIRLCYQKVLLRLAGLHLQAAGIMIGVETGTYIIFHFLLHTPTGSAPA